MTSCASVTKRDPLTRESIEEAVKAKQADAVVATILVSKDWHMKKGGDMDTRAEAATRPSIPAGPITTASTASMACQSSMPSSRPRPR